MAKYSIAWLPGDGIGVEVMEAARIVLDAVGLEPDQHLNIRDERGNGHDERYRHALGILRAVGDHEQKLLGHGCRLLMLTGGLAGQRTVRWRQLDRTPDLRATPPRVAARRSSRLAGGR